MNNSFEKKSTFSFADLLLLLGLIILATTLSVYFLEFTKRQQSSSSKLSIPESVDSLPKKDDDSAQSAATKKKTRPIPEEARKALLPYMK